MVHNPTLNAKMHTTIKLPVKITISYDELISKNSEEETSTQSSFYLADGSGCKISKVLEGTHGNCRTIPEIIS